LAWLGALTSAPACATSELFVCEAVEDCAADGVLGVCQPSGFCSFPSDECASHQRYGAHAPHGLAGMCVPSVDDADTSSGEAGEAGEAGTLPDPGTSSAGETDPAVSAGTQGDDGSTGDDAASEDSGGAQESTTDATTGAPSTCGDGIVDDGEWCDGDIEGEEEDDELSCVDVGFTGGALGCDASCVLDTSGCQGCGVPLPAPGGACPPSCDLCEGTLCRFLCEGDSACEEASIDCPDGWDCAITCSGFESCKKLEIQGPDVQRLTVDCQGERACKETKIECGYGLCDLSCGADSEVCAGAKQTCGAQACTATCALEAGKPAIECGPACTCDGC